MKAPSFRRIMFWVISFVFLPYAFMMNLHANQASSEDIDIKIPKSEYTFSLLDSRDGHSVNVDKSTLKTKVDKDGDVMIGAVFLTISKSPIEVEKKMAHTFIQVIIGACGYKKVIIGRTMAYDKDGNLIKDALKKVLIDDEDDPGSIQTQAYKMLCGDKFIPHAGGNYT